VKKIIGYRKLLGVNEKADLQELKTTYRNLMKTWHPDKFQETEEMKNNAEAKSKHIIEAYHFLVSIAPETRDQNLEAYTLTINTSAIVDFDYKSETLTLKFADGTNYEYFGVPKATYVKLVNAPAPARFARRHICNSFAYRSAGKELETA
jgi:curved DNA-binding protein CbpA